LIRRGLPQPRSIARFGGGRHVRSRFLALALVMGALALFAGPPVAHAASVPETHYFFHAAGTTVAAGDAGTYDTTAPTGSDPSYAPGDALGAVLPTWNGSVGGVVDTLKVDFWQKAPVADAEVGEADYDVFVTVGSQTYAFPTFTSPTAVGPQLDEVSHVFTSTEANSPLPIDASSGPVTIQIEGHYVDAEAVTVIVYDATSAPSGFAVNVPPPTSGTIPPLQQAAGGSTFGQPVVIPQSDNFGEPSIDVAPVGTQGTTGHPQTIWITTPRGLGSSATEASPVWRSDDGGASFSAPITTANVGPLETTLGGGDSDIQTDKDGNVYQNDLWLGDDSMSFSTDKGQTWTGSPVSHIRPIDDRAWLAYSKDEQAMYLTYDGESGIYLDKALIGTLGPSATLLFQQETLVDNNATRGCVCPPGSLTVDDSRAGATPYVYDVFAANGGVRVYRSDDGGLTFTHTTIPKSGSNPDRSFTVSAVDAVGNLYVAWTNTVNGVTGVYFASSTNHGQSWQGPFDVSALIGPQRAALFPAITSDATGHVGLALYGTPNAVDPDTAPNGTVWNVYYAESRDAATADPSFTFTNIVPDFHEGQICTSGINCGSNDRSLLDFFSVQFDANSVANIIYTEGGQSTGTKLAFVKQTGSTTAQVKTALTYTGDTSGTKGTSTTYSALLKDSKKRVVGGAGRHVQAGLAGGGHRRDPLRRPGHGHPEGVARGGDLHADHDLCGGRDARGVLDLEAVHGEGGRGWIRHGRPDPGRAEERRRGAEHRDRPRGEPVRLLPRRRDQLLPVHEPRHDLGQGRARRHEQRRHVGERRLQRRRLPEQPERHQHQPERAAGRGLQVQGPR
jgi:hypothetical protein